MMEIHPPLMYVLQATHHQYYTLPGTPHFTASVQWMAPGLLVLNQGFSLRFLVILTGQVAGLGAQRSSCDRFLNSIERSFNLDIMSREHSLSREHSSLQRGPAGEIESSLHDPMSAAEPSRADEDGNLGGTRVGSAEAAVSEACRNLNAVQVATVEPPDWFFPSPSSCTRHQASPSSPRHKTSPASPEDQMEQAQMPAQGVLREAVRTDRPRYQDESDWHAEGASQCPHTDQHDRQSEEQTSAVDELADGTMRHEPYLDSAAARESEHDRNYQLQRGLPIPAGLEFATQQHSLSHCLQGGSDRVSQVTLAEGDLLDIEVEELVLQGAARYNDQCGGSASWGKGVSDYRMEVNILLMR